MNKCSYGHSGLYKIAVRGNFPGSTDTGGGAGGGGGGGGGEGQIQKPSPPRSPRGVSSSAVATETSQINMTRLAASHQTVMSILGSRAGCKIYFTLYACFMFISIIIKSCQLNQIRKLVIHYVMFSAVYCC